MTIEELKKLHYEVKPCEEADIAYIEEQCGNYDNTVVPPRPGAKAEQIVRKITDEDGNIIAGCVLGISDWDIAYLHLLWVDERCRRRGMGAALVRAVEGEARERNCPLIYLGTLDFQAKPFYEKQGYRLCGTNENWPKGHCNHIMMKRLDSKPRQNSSCEGMGRFEIKAGSEADADFIDQKLGEYNAHFAPPENPDKVIPLSRKITDAQGKLIAGIRAEVDDWETAQVEGLWVEEHYRGQGLGSFLLHSFGQEAKEKGAYLALADCCDWSAGVFFANGYEAWSTVEDMPKGHSWHVFRKPL